MTRMNVLSESSSEVKSSSWTGRGRSVQIDVYMQSRTWYQSAPPRSSSSKEWRAEADAFLATKEGEAYASARRVERRGQELWLG